MNALYRDLKRLVSFTEEAAKRQKKDGWRLGFHLMPPTGWLNDPNGLCVYGGEYHIFFQYSPFDAQGGVKMWGHFKGKDMLHWEYMGAALYPDQPFDVHGVYSGSAFVEDGKMYLLYTGNVKQTGRHDYINSGREHNTVLAVSENGQDFEEKECLMTNADYPLDTTCHVRDPKVWKEKDTYFMVQGARRKDDRGEILLFSSKNIRDWKLENRITTEEPFGYMWECPDYMVVDGQRLLVCCPQGVDKQGILYQNIYQCGYFKVNGDITEKDEEKAAGLLGEFEELDYGFDFYAPQSFQDMDGRRILIGWVGMPDADYGNATVEKGWQHCLSIPRVLTWKKGRLYQNPVDELQELRGEESTLKIRGEHRFAASQTFELFLEHISGEKLEIVLNEHLKYRYDREQGLLSLCMEGDEACGRKERFVKIENLENVRILADTSCLELFANDGEKVMTTRFYPASASRNLTIKGNADMHFWALKDMEISW